jgi:glutamate--cysteine ligase
MPPTVSPQHHERRANVTHADSQLDQPIASFDDLLGIFHSAAKPASEFRIGAEMEKFGVYSATGEPVPYDGDRGILRVLRSLAEEHDWAPEAETEGGPIIALLRNHASITLEPGAQLELSGAPLQTIHQICAELRGHMAELAPISKELGITWLGLGFHPFAKRSDLRFVPKQRYAIMREYLPTRGAHALDMMLRTCTVQANYDYLNEADAIQKMRVALKLSPLTTALFANSPWKEGAPHGGLSYRGRVWLDVDPDRSGLVPNLWAKDASFASYVEWALDIPMFLFKRNGEKVENTGQTFRSFWKSGFEGHHATQADWQLHLNTLFPEVRLKKTIEVRGADSQGQNMACALPALWTGLLYDDRALNEADALTADWTHAEVEASRADVCSKGLAATFRGRTLQSIAEQVVTIAEGGLERRAYQRADGKDERVHLLRLRELVEHGQTPANRLLDGVKDGASFRADVIARADLTRS